MNDFEINRNDFPLKIVDLSGYSFSGKSAVFDLLSEFKGYKSHSKEFEFELLRTAGGILDLENALVHNWSPIRSSEAIRRFKKLIKSYGGTNRLTSRLFSIGYQYDNYFPGFTEKSEDYLESLIMAKWDSDWPFALNDLPISSVIYRKLKSKLGFKHAYEFEVYLSRMSEEDFVGLTQIYLQNIFSGFIGRDDKAVVVNNMCEPFYPQKSHKFFLHPKSIIVDRDPRDIYMSAYQQGVIGKSNVGKAVLGSSLNDFIKRFLAYRAGNDNENSNILKLSFENLVLDYDVSKNKILRFLEEENSIHIYPKKYFDPNISIKGVGLWKKATGQTKEAIQVINSELNEFCIKL